VIKGVNPLIHFFRFSTKFVVFVESTWPFFLKLNLSNTIYCLKRIWFLYVLSENHEMFKVLQWTAMRSQTTPTLKIATSFPEIQYS
jgi:hypothetical protein